MGCFNFVTVPGNLTNGLLIDHVGRRKFILAGCISLCIVLCVETALTARYAEADPSNKVGLGFGVAFIFLFPVFYSLCLDATMYLYPAEIFPMIIRSFGISFSISGQWLASTILLGAAPTAFQNCGYKFWFLFIFSCVVYGVLVYFFLPEVSDYHEVSMTLANRKQTKGKTLEEISLVFGDPVGLTDLEPPAETGSIDEEKVNSEYIEKGAAKEL